MKMPFFTLGKAPGKSLGFSLIEVMVAMVIGLLGTIVIFQVFAVSEGQKRTTTGGGEAQQNGAIALFNIEREGRMAGYGVAALASLGCPILAYNANRNPKNFNLTLAPIVITRPPEQAPVAVTTAPDQITLMYGSSNTLSSPVRLGSPDMLLPTDAYRMVNRFGFALGNLVIAVQPLKNCTLAQITELPADAGNTLIIRHNSGDVDYPYNDPNVADAYTSAGSLLDLGLAPTAITYFISNNQLQMRDELTGVSTPIMEHIVQMQAQYGKDTSVPADGIVDVWDDIPPANAAVWQQVMAMRLALVARSPQPENAAGGCKATAANPEWIGSGSATSILDLSLLPDWRCYRYKTFQTTVPLRNAIWR